jgi:hypothetical protein
VAGRRYAFGAGDPSIAHAVAAKQARDEQEVASLVRTGMQAVEVVYADGGSHQSFRDAVMAGQRDLGDVSRADALASGPREIAVGAAAREPALAFASADTRAAAPSEASVGVSRAPKSIPADEPSLYRRLIGNLFGGASAGKP